MIECKRLPNDLLTFFLVQFLLMQGGNMTTVAPAETREFKGTQLKRKVSSLFKKKPERSILKKPNDDQKTRNESPSELLHSRNFRSLH